ncbi:DNA-binding Lrp family transcriptional regulator [Spinactinospora alkalitolerans]|uniref:DNA-binding Lrp family transcriptional regulator n=1 Tax=Spinactinospora alkalitolerans TaxID=687207 RepID=A0A852TP01_9ACTN|nr:Lrp/AsnC family transcriptional regulator [Spinactinospora alkalitolerans]NYE46086.1 DNA-binding Lrp family transcriptional regulator [Spinactinospora alkalitolerans]
MRLDDVDERIVALLGADARATFAEIGAAVGLSASAVKRRIDRLTASGVIRGFTVRLDPAAIGWGTEAYIELYCRARTSPTEIRAGLTGCAEVISACTVTGDADAVVHIRARDVGHLEETIERIGAQPFVVRTKSTLVLSRLVDQQVLPEPAPDMAPAGL